MIRNKPTTSLMEQKPRKMLKLDLINEACYNEFQGNSQIDEQNFQNLQETNYEAQSCKNQTKTKDEKCIPIDQQISENQKIFRLISKEHLKFKKVNNSKEPAKQDNKTSHIASKNTKQEVVTFKNEVKLEEGVEPIETKRQQEPSIKTKKDTKIQNVPKNKVPEPSSNWKKFLEKPNPSQSLVKPGQIHNSNIQDQSSTQKTKQSSRFVALDCEFVKCEESDELARISIVSQNSQTLYDSYIKPSKKVTDFITEITGITYTHIKNAPLWTQEVDKVKKILMGKILVGHTLHKDLEVTKLDKWKGISRKVDIADFSQYREKNGSKVVSLKRMAISFLNRNIQSGWHSSVEDASATMDLFKLNKKKILKQNKLI